MAEKETITVDEEANPELAGMNGRIRPPPSSNRLTKRTLLLIVAAAIICFSAGLLTGAYGIDTSDDDDSDYRQIGQSIASADTPRGVYSITPISLGENRQGRKRLAVGDPIYSHSTDPEAPQGNTEDGRGRVRIFELQGAQWKQVGRELYGESTNSAFGYAVDLSPDGSTLAVGGRSHDGSSGERRGAVFVYSFDEDVNEWTLQADDSQMQRPLAYGYCGNTVSLSEDGTMVAFPCAGTVVRATWTGENSWDEEVVILESSGSNFTLADCDDVTLSADGTTLFATSGVDARILDRDNAGGSWTVRGDSLIDAGTTSTTLAETLLDSTVQLHLQDSNSRPYAMNKEGTILAVLFASSDETPYPIIRTYRDLDGSSPRKHFGTDIAIDDGLIVGPYFSYYTASMALSDDGLQLVVNFSVDFSFQGDLENLAYVFEYRWGTWQPSGKPLSVRAGHARVDMSSSGSMIALVYNDGHEAKDFLIRTFQQH